ncbi:MAG: HAD family hydrolase [Deltaproteobacteria bacterium]|nr:HAD family hydrolase [Deltaproteobacteria bacterium]MBI2500538.1 HAD family hydrolase [Deltaproteobacteria bacterium]
MKRDVQRAVFLDRDGTINVDRGYVYRIDQFEFIPGAVEAMRRLTENQIAIYIVTNQAGIGLGLYTEEDFWGLTRHMLGTLAQNGVRVEQVFFCPHHPEATLEQYRQKCGCRKPETGLFEAVLKEYPKERLTLVGDKKSDIEAGQRLGIRTYLVETGYGAEHKNQVRADFVAPDLKTAVDHLLRV